MSFIEQELKIIGKELEYVATYANPERRVELLNFLKGQFSQSLTRFGQRMVEEGIDMSKIVTEWSGKVVEDSPNYKTGYNQAITDYREKIKTLLDVNH